MDYAYLVTYRIFQPDDSNGEHGIFICATKSAANNKYTSLVREWKDTLSTSENNICDVDEPQDNDAVSYACISNGSSTVNIVLSKQKVLH